MTDPAERPGRQRRTFGPVVLLALASGGFGAYAGTKPWVDGEGADSGPGFAATAWGEVSSSPLATALAFVLMACVGVVLVTRGRFRRAIAWLAVLVAVGYAATVAWAPFSLPDHLREQVRVRTGAQLDSTSLTGSYYAGVLAAVLVVASALLMVRLVRSWPEMGSRYDAPAGERSAPGAAHEVAPGPAAEVPSDNIDIWKALDEGRDPTA